MEINLIVYSLLLLVGYKYWKIDNLENRKKLIIVSSFILLLKTSLRSVSVGSDTCHYAHYFNEMQGRTWSEMIRLFEERYINTGLFGGDDDIGYQLLTKIISIFTDSFGIFTFVMQGFLFFLPIGLLLLRYNISTKQILFSYILLNALFMGLPMANARQVYAIGISIFSFLYIIDKKYTKSILCLLIAFTIHKSSLLALIPFSLSLIPPKFYKWTVIMSFPFSFFTLTSSSTMITAMGNFIGSDKYAAYGHETSAGGAVVYISFSLLMALFCAISLWKETEDGQKDKSLLYSMIPLTVIFCPLIYNNGSMIRIALYFQIFFLVLMPWAVRLYFKKPDRVLYMLIGLLILMSLISPTEYKFFWEENQNPLLYW